MDRHNIYAVGDQDQKQRVKNEQPERDCSNDSGQVYMVLNAAQVKTNTYENLQIGNTTREEIDKWVEDTKKTRVWITICIFLTVLAVITFIALAVGALGMRSSSNAQLSIAEGARNYTTLMEELSALRNLLTQMNFEIQGNISQLDNRLSSSGSSLSRSVRRVSNSASSVNSRVNQIRNSASRNSNSINMIRSSASRISSTVSRLSSISVRSLSSSVSQLSTSLARCTSTRC